MGERSLIGGGLHVSRRLLIDGVHGGWPATWHHLLMDSVENSNGDAIGAVADSAGFPLDGGFACPRCGRSVTEEYYGPCTSCRTTLRMSVTADAKEVDDVAYEPKMNVTPNAVALKD